MEDGQTLSQSNRGSLPPFHFEAAHTSAESWAYNPPQGTSASRGLALLSRAWHCQDWRWAMDYLLQRLVMSLLP
jgi:hypothetical protein